MKVESILLAKGSQVETVEPEASVTRVIEKLIYRGVGAMVVSRDGKRLEGIISERDVVQGLHTFGASLTEMRAREIMSKGVPVCSPDDPITRVMAEMTRSRNRHLPVMKDGVLCGIVSVGDVVKLRLEELELETSVLRDRYIAGR
ncbi:CBS domain-containing protein [soil metagenome]